MRGFESQGAPQPSAAGTFLLDASHMETTKPTEAVIWSLPQSSGAWSLGLRTVRSGVAAAAGSLPPWGFLVPQEVPRGSCPPSSSLPVLRPHPYFTHVGFVKGEGGPGSPARPPVLLNFGETLFTSYGGVLKEALPFVSPSSPRDDRHPKAARV